MNSDSFVTDHSSKIKYFKKRNNFRMQQVIILLSFLAFGRDLAQI